MLTFDSLFISAAGVQMVSARANIIRFYISCVALPLDACPNLVFKLGAELFELFDDLLLVSSDLFGLS